MLFRSGRGPRQPHVVVTVSGAGVSPCPWDVRGALSSLPLPACEFTPVHGLLVCRR